MSRRRRLYMPRRETPNNLRYLGMRIGGCEEAKGCPKGAPKSTQKHQKSFRIILGAAMERPSHRALKRNGSWILPGRSQCRSSTINTMLFVLPPTWLQTICLLTLGLLRAPFLGPWAPKWHPVSEKGPSNKNIKNNLLKSSKKSPKLPPNRLG